MATPRRRSSVALAELWPGQVITCPTCSRPELVTRVVVVDKGRAYVTTKSCRHVGAHTDVVMVVPA